MLRSNFKLINLPLSLNAHSTTMVTIIRVKHNSSKRKSGSKESNQKPVELSTQFGQLFFFSNKYFRTGTSSYESEREDSPSPFP